MRILEEWLHRYPRRQDAEYLIDGFRFGFRIPFQGVWAPYMACNLCSVAEMEEVVWEKIAKELR